MDEPLDIVDGVNALLKLGVGDPYRLEHIKQAYIQDKVIWQSDRNYLQQMKEKYLTKHSDVQTGIEDLDDAENKELIHCWKCGKKVPLASNFCMICGSSVFEVGTEPKPVEVERPSQVKKVTKSIGLKIPIMIGIPVLILIILGVGYSQGYFDSAFEGSSNDPISTEIEDEEIFYGEFDPKCGAGTVLDPETNECRGGSVKPASQGETDEKCGTGTVLKDGECVLDK